jgi:2-polyprenyl-3-methyl-5-hydroxy-6-metoxy-1,4-benzoquinol methylase
MTTTNTREEHVDWDDHWRHYAKTAELNPAQRYRRQIACRFLERSGCAGAVRILDFGSGQGDLIQDLRRLFPRAELAGVELSAAGVAEAARKVPDAHFQQRDLLDAGADPGPLRSWAQYAVCAEVLEHLDDPALFLKHVSWYLAPGCTLVVTVPGGPQSEFDRHIGHRQHFTPQRLRSLLEQCGFKVQRATTAGFPFFNLYRMAVILRGKRLITDVRSDSTTPSSGLARAVMSAFGPLFSLNLLGSPFGWQTIAAARWPGHATPDESSR